MCVRVRFVILPIKYYYYYYYYHDVFEQAASLWCSNVVMVHKCDGTTWFCVMVHKCDGTTITAKECGWLHGNSGDHLIEEPQTQQSCGRGVHTRSDKVFLQEVGYHLPADLCASSADGRQAWGHPLFTAQHGHQTWQLFYLFALTCPLDAIVTAPSLEPAGFTCKCSCRRLLLPCELPQGSKCRGRRSITTLPSSLIGLRKSIKYFSSIHISSEDTMPNDTFREGALDS